MSSLQLPGPIVSSEWLNSQLSHPHLVVLDATIAPANQSAVGPKFDYQIPGTQRFDFDKVICDTNSSLPHMMPTAELFTREVQRLGVSQNSVIVIYDRIGIYSSPRGRWMFKAMGHDAVAVLDGGFPGWQNSNFPIEQSPGYQPDLGDFIAKPKSDFFCDMIAVAQAISNKSLIVDARSAGRFFGREPEPRAGLKSGHIPTSQNLPFNEVLNGLHLRGIEELKEKFSNLAATPNSEIIFTCGSGVTACIVALAAEVSGYSRLSVYDGSWSEWGRTDA